jgi:hypothetical protein
MLVETLRQCIKLKKALVDHFNNFSSKPHLEITNFVIRIKKTINLALKRDPCMIRNVSILTYTPTWLLSTNLDQFSETVTRVDYKEGG